MNKKTKINRRSFIGSGLAAAATVAVGNSVIAGKETFPETTPVKGKDEHPFNPRTYSAMPTNVFGKTGYKVGILSLGGQATLETAGMDELSEKIINRAIDLGINYIDLWQLHNVQRQDQVDQMFTVDGAIKALEKAKAEGTVRYVGITGHFEPIVLMEAIRRYPFDSILMALNAADVHYLSFKNYLLPEVLRKGIAIVGMKVATRGRMLSCWTPPPLEEQPERLRTPKQGTITIKEALMYNMSLPVSTTIIGVDTVEQIEENVKIASEFSPLSEAEMNEIEFKTLPIVRQGLYFRRWDLGE